MRTTILALVIATAWPTFGEEPDFRKVISDVSTALSDVSDPDAPGDLSRYVLGEVLSNSSSALAKGLKSRVWTRATEDGAPIARTLGICEHYKILLQHASTMCTREVNYALLYALDFSFSGGSLRDFTDRSDFGDYPAVQILLKNRVPDQVRGETISFIANGDSAVLREDGQRALWFVMSRVFGGAKEATDFLEVRVTKYEGEERLRLAKFLEYVRGLKTKE